MTPTTEHNEILKILRKEIYLNPKMKHRIILKAIKTAKTKELGIVIRNYKKKTFYKRVLVCLKWAKDVFSIDDNSRSLFVVNLVTA